jgi:hypothetical protein
MRRPISGQSPRREWGPFGDLSWAAPVGELPLRVSVNGFGDLYRYTEAPGVNVDRVGGSARLQYVDPYNDQAFSPPFDARPAVVEKAAGRSGR